MTATEQNDLALHFVKQAGPYSTASAAASSFGNTIWDGAKWMPGPVGAAANWASAGKNLWQGNIGQGLMDAGMGAASLVGGNLAAKGLGFAGKALGFGGGMVYGESERRAQAESQKQTMNQAKNYVDTLRGSAGNHINPQLT